MRLVRGFRPRVVLALLLVVCGGCASTSAGRSAPDAPGAGSSESAARAFLDAARVKDYGTMASHFGTREGPAEKRFGVTEVEQRMIFLAAILAHTSYELRVENLAQFGPERVRWVARLEGTRRGVVDVPVVTVPTPGGRWFVELLGLDDLTASTGR